MTTLKVYLEVIEDVVNNVKSLFVEDGIDEQILTELKQMWETKLRATKAAPQRSDIERQGLKKLSDINGFPKQPPQKVVQQVVGQVPPNNHVQTQGVPQIIGTKMIPIQITLPSQPGTNTAPNVLTIQIPTTALQGNQLQKLLTGPIITAAMSLPSALATSILQQHVNEMLNQQQQVVLQIAKPISQSDGTHMSNAESSSKQNSQGPPSQVDGPMDTSDEDEGVSENESCNDEDDEMEVNVGVTEEKPLNSEDDVSDDDTVDLYDTDNIVVCQYDKIMRTRNKWKFFLEGGIMNLNGEDYLFQKASGDAEW